MGRRKFRLSDMMPNSWFYKLRDMGRAGGATSTRHPPLASVGGAKPGTHPAGTPRPMPVPMPHRSSYYYASRDRLLQPSPAPLVPQTKEKDRRHHQLVPQTQSQSPARRSFKRQQHKVGPPDVSEVEPIDAHHRRRSTSRRDTCVVGRDGSGDVGKHEQARKKPPPPAGKKAATASKKKHVFTGKVIASETDITFDLGADDMPEKVLRPIATKPPASARRDHHQVGSRYDPQAKESRRVVHHHHHGHAAATPRTSSASDSRRSSVSSAGGRRLKTRANSPRLAVACRCRKGRSSSATATTPAATSATRKAAPAPARAPPLLEESFAVVKDSVDPRKDFRDSMEEMIAVQGIRDAEDLEDLLACYLALNAPEHHDLIVQVFEEIWVSLAGIINL